MERPYIQLLVAIGVTILIPLLEKMFKRFKKILSEVMSIQDSQRHPAAATPRHAPARPAPPPPPAHIVTPAEPRTFIGSPDDEGGRITADIPERQSGQGDEMSAEARRQLRNAFIWSEILKRKF